MPIDAKASDFNYTNVIMNNPGPQIVTADYYEERRIPFIGDMESYQIAITRIKIPTSSIPLFEFQHNSYYVSFTLGPDNTNPITVPVSYYLVKSRDKQDFVWNYSDFLNMVNLALSDLWAQAVANPAYNIDPSLANFPPYFLLQEASPFVQLILPYDNAEPFGTPFHRFSATSPPPSEMLATNINLFMSGQLYYFFSGFPSYSYRPEGATGDVNLMNRFIFYPQKLQEGLTTLQTMGTDPAYATRTAITVFPDYSFLYLWQKLSRVFVTSAMPIHFEALSVRGDQGEARTIQMLNDWEVSPTADGRQREYINFAVQGEPRWHNFTNTGPLTILHLQFHLQLSDLTTMPLEILPGFEVSTKILFQRRWSTAIKQYSEEEINSDKLPLSRKFIT